MKKITLIFTVHREQGACTSNILVGILEKINPEVVFEEIHPDRFDSYYKDKAIRTLETEAILTYIKRHTIRQVPVDNFDLSKIKEYHKKISDTLNQIDECSDEICRYLELQTMKVHNFGFSFLNSLEYTNIANEIDRLREEIVIKTNDEMIKKNYSLWLGLLKSRECNMLNNINDYCNKNEFNKGLFIVGSGHRNALIKEIENNRSLKNMNIYWNYIEYNGLF